MTFFFLVFLPQSSLRPRGGAEADLADAVCSGRVAGMQGAGVAAKAKFISILLYIQS